MSLRFVSSRYFFLGLVSGFSGIFASFLFLVNSGVGSFSSLGAGSYFYFDYLSFCFSLISVFLGLCLYACAGLRALFGTGVYIFLSVFFSVLCYTSSNVYAFWFNYELSILFLLFLLIINSPYSERYIASWYLLGYVVFTSLPMFLCIFYVSSETGSLSLLDWCTSEVSFGSWFCLILLSVLFITKVPLLPFHVWLPIVHAEATSPVSVCLSGYIMKLGILGLYRFVGSHVEYDVFGGLYVFLILSFSMVFFMSSCRELDGKRWLAFLSLSHISVCCFGLCVCDFYNCCLPYYFCLGHGLSAGVTFVYLWCMYDFVGSRNWMVLKSGLSGNSCVAFVCVLSVFSAASVPPTITFFSEVLFIESGVFKALLLTCLFCVYLFLGGLIPLFLLGSLLGYGVCSGVSGCGFYGYMCGCVFILFWVYFGFLVV